MTWLMWRQHRTEALALAIAVGGLAIGLYVLGRPLYALFPQGTTACLGVPLDQSCRIASAGLEQGAGGRVALLVLLNFVPFAIGGLLGAPLLGRELEAGTWQLAWTQTVPRRQWLAVKVMVLGLLTIALASGLSAAITGYRRPLGVVGGFDLTGVAPMAYALFAFALGVAAGTLLGRALPAAAVALVVFVAVRVPVTAWVRPHLVAPLTDLDGGERLRDPVLQRGFIDHDGRHITGLDAAMGRGPRPRERRRPGPLPARARPCSSGSSTNRPTGTGPSN